jgi:hypothetical protein
MGVFFGCSTSFSLCVCVFVPDVHVEESGAEEAVIPQALPPIGMERKREKDKERGKVSVCKKSQPKNFKTALERSNRSAAEKRRQAWSPNFYLSLVCISRCVWQ